jgi:TetR/AcrR family transcriptional regulator, fatty acid metabolism regulator protein
MLMTTPHKSEIRRKQLLKAAEKVFAQKGYQDATISDVAREAKVSDATIYEYFPSKEDLLFSIPGEMTRKYKDEIIKILSYVRGWGEKLRCVIQHYFWFYERHPDYASVAMLILKQNRNFLDKEAYQEVREHAQLILHLIEEGRRCGEFRSDINPYLIRAMILGTIEHLVIRRVLLGKPERLVPFTDQFWNLISGGITLPLDEKTFTVRFSPEPGGIAEKGEHPTDKKRKSLGDKKG